jgi:hypothetical protein
MRKCNPPHKRNAKEPTHCNTCNVLFTKDNMRRNLGYLNRKCKDCISKHNTERQRLKREKEVAARWF